MKQIPVRSQVLLLSAVVGLLTACSNVPLETRAAKTGHLELGEAVQTCRQNMDTTTYLDCKKRAEAQNARVQRESKP